jgi:serine/threonine-protein kinase
VGTSEPALNDLAAAILDGTSVDWQTVDASASEAERPLLEELRVLATLAEVHRAQRGSGEPTRRMETWGHLRVLEPIGSGAFGHVYRAWDSRLDREVALKLLPAQSDVGSARRSSIIHEGRLLARVRHPNVVTIHGAERIGDIIGLWMERIDGETVEQRLARESPIRPSEAIQIAVQICHAVAAVHRAGLLHRDIKAQNVMLASDGRAVLMDFGTGWEVGDASTSDTSWAGTPLYLAPEVLRGGSATIQSDVYSLGVLLYRMLTGTYPVRARSLPELRAAQERRERGEVVGAGHRIPRRLGRIITRAIDSRPERRYQSADALAEAIAALGPRAPRVPLRYAIAAGVAVAVTGWWVADRHMPAATVAKRAEVPAIAVLPLENLSGESGSDEIADGFTTEIISNLAKNEHLKVRSRASSFAFTDKKNDLQDIARQLNVTLIVEGSIRRSGERVQVEARLVRARSGLAVWHETFETNSRDLIAVPDLITAGIVSSLGLTPAHVHQMYEVKPEAYGRYLTARALMTRSRGSGGVQSAQKAVEYFQQVIALDPAFAPAYAGLADAYAYMSLPTSQGMPVGKAQELMRTAALKALEMDPDLSEAHAAMGVVDARHLDWQASQREFERAIALNPSLSQVYTSYSFFTLRPLRKFEDAERLLDIALRADPLSLDVWREMAEVHFTVGRYDDAIDVLQRVRAVDPQLTDATVVLARALACRGRPDEALALYDAIDPAAAGVPHYRAYAYVRAGRRSDAERLAIENASYPYRATIIYAALGDLDRAFEALAQTAEREPQRIPLLLTWPEMASLRSGPRFSAVQKRFGLP